MPNNHPYDKKSDRRQQDLNDLVDGAVNFGLASVPRCFPVLPAHWTVWGIP